ARRWAAGCGNGPTGCLGVGGLHGEHGGVARRHAPADRDAGKASREILTRRCGRLDHRQFRR
ncbi:MAG: hypothetical protein ACRDZ6_05635, partial [Acidimicrobiales bacterium]